MERSEEALARVEALALRQVGRSLLTEVAVRALLCSRLRMRLSQGALTVMVGAL
jgi:hypothetical protein